MAVATGSIRFNTDSSKMEIYNGEKWWEVDSTPGTNAPRGILAGNYGNDQETIDYIQIATTGNASDFGNLVTGTCAAAAMASSTRMVFAGGYTPAGITAEIQYIENIASAGNSIDWGVNISSIRKQAAGLADKTRGVYAGGFWPSHRNEIEYVTIAQKGITTDFGDLSTQKRYPMGCSSSTRGLIISGSNFPGSPGTTNDIEYITIQSTGSAKDFGDINTACTYAGAAAANATRALHAGGFVSPGNINTIDYVTIATQGNASDFGDLGQAEHGGTGMSSSTRAVFGGMWDGGADVNMYYVTITTLGHAKDFGDANMSAYYRFGGSNTHGGVQG